MVKIWSIIKQDLRVFLQSRSNLISLVLTPAVMTIIIALVDSGAFSGTPVRILDVIDQDGSPASAQFLDAVRQANPELTLCPVDNTAKDICGLGQAGTLSESQALDRVAKSTSRALLEIPAGYGADLAALQPVTLTFRSSSTFGSSQAVQAALSRVNAAAVASRIGLSAFSTLQSQPLSGDQAGQVQSGLYQQALKLEQAKPVSVDFALSGDPTGGTMGEHLQFGLGQSVPGMGTMFAMMTIFGGMAALIVERQQWTLPRLASMPVSRGTLLSGKILARFSLGLLQFLVVFIVGALFKMNFGKDPLALVLLVVVTSLAVTAFAFAVGSGLKNPAQASGLGLLLTLTLAPLGGAWWPMNISPKFLQIIGHVSPVAWAMDGFTALTYNGAHLTDIWLPLVVLAGMTVVLFLIAIPRFKYQVD
jgi:linearmycin/streptolysin S transport system permease protein